MSQGTACKVKAHASAWVVLQRMCNFSAFSGYHYTPSDYSCVRCMTCGAVWRTKAGFVRRLPDITEEQRKIYLSGVTLSIVT